MRVIIDCNVLISSGWNDGLSRQAFYECITHHEVFITKEILEEYQRVLAYPKFDHIQDTLKRNLSDFLLVATFTKPLPCPFSLPDHNDEAYLAAALTIEADVILTGNSRHYPQKRYGTVLVLTAREFLDLVGCETK